jgi:RNA polymerase-associated protein CTR9
MQHPKEWPAKLLLGLEGLNSIHDDTLTDAQRAQAILAAAKGYLEPAFNANQRNASAANALCQLMLQKRESKKVWGYHTLT